MPAKTSIEIRLAVPSDSVAIADVLREAFSVLREYYTDAAFDVVTPAADIVRTRFEEGPMWDAVDDGLVVGTVSVTFEPEGLYIRSMAVKPGSQGRGIGHRLLDAIDEFAATVEAARVFLYTTYFTPGAKEMYEKHGFRKVRETSAEEWYGVPGLEMEKVL
jgi:N-acetylglutamate synthase-like GNAT family acetyltransferase